MTHNEEEQKCYVEGEETAQESKERITEEINKILPPVKWRSYILQDEFIDIPKEIFEYINSRKKILSFVSKTLSQQKESFRKLITEKQDCIGPTDELHRCSYAHCDNCGVCELLFNILKEVENL